MNTRVKIILYTLLVKYLPISYRTPFKVSKKLRGFFGGGYIKETW